MTRKWSDVFRHIIDCHEEESESHRRWRILEKDEAFDFIRHILVAETRAVGQDQKDSARPLEDLCMTLRPDFR